VPANVSSIWFPYKNYNTRLQWQENRKKGSCKLIAFPLSQRYLAASLEDWLGIFTARSHFFVPRHRHSVAVEQVKKWRWRWGISRSYQVLGLVKTPLGHINDVTRRAWVMSFALVFISCSAFVCLPMSHLFVIVLKSLVSGNTLFEERFKGYLKVILLIRETSNSLHNFNQICVVSGWTLLSHYNYILRYF